MHSPIDNSNLFLQRAKEIAELFRKHLRDEVVIVHHNDCDGLSSGHILASAMARLGISYRTLCLEKPYPQVIQNLLNDDTLNPNTLFLFTDFASGMLSTLTELNINKHPIFVLDHHTISPPTRETENLFLLNCREFGIDGNRECTASTVCFQFALCLDTLNSDLAEVALLGAVGDGQLDDNGNFVGLNHRALSHISPIPESPDFHLPNFRFDAKDISDALDALGSFGYLEGGPDKALDGLALGMKEPFWHEAQGFRKAFQDELAQFLDSLELNSTEKLQWFTLGTAFQGMGVKTVGLICEILFREGRADPEKYLAGFQTIPRTIPSLGTLPRLGVKVSMRVVPPLRTKIEEGSAPPLNVLLPEATKVLGGFSDACHLHAAAVTIPEGKERELVDELLKLL